VDDVLGTWGDPVTTGEPVARDLRERKMSLPIAHTLATERGSLLAAALAGDFDERACAAATAALDEAGARAWCVAFADVHLGRALKALEGGHLEAARAADLAQMARYLIGRGS